jgi:hypothetical protein
MKNYPAQEENYTKYSECPTFKKLTPAIERVYHGNRKNHIKSMGRWSLD